MGAEVFSALLRAADNARQSVRSARLAALGSVRVLGPGWRNCIPVLLRSSFDSLPPSAQFSFDMPERDMVWSLPEDLPLDDFMQLGQLLLVIQRLCFLMQRMGTRDRDVELHCGGMGRRDWSSLLLWARHLVGASAGEDRSYLRMKTNVPGTPDFALQLRAQIEHGHAAVPAAGQQAAAPAPAAAPVAAPAAAAPSVGKRKAPVSPTPATAPKRRSVPPPFRHEAGLRVLNLLGPMLEPCLRICLDL
jgi:hypothetical protein